MLRDDERDVQRVHVALDVDSHEANKRPPVGTFGEKLLALAEHVEADIAERQAIEERRA